MPERFYYGLSGIALPFPKSSYPAEFRDKTRLEFYSSLFNSLEVNSCFYKLPQAAKVAKWADLVPGDFKFTFKLSKEITHAKNLAFKAEDAEKFIKAIDAAKHKSRCILIQFPPSVTIGLINEFRELLSEVSYLNNNVWRLAVEFRHRSWHEREVSEILDEFNACIVLQDLPASATPLQYGTGKTIYLRFHGPAGGYRGSYDKLFLNQYANQIAYWLNSQREVFCYFNNTMGDAMNNLQTLKTLLSSAENSSIISQPNIKLDHE